MNRKLYQADWATEADDAALRRLMSETVQEGSVALSLEREPSFFDSMIGVARHDTVAVRRVDDGELIACGSRVEHHARLHGREQTIAYLGNLRVHPACRRLTGRVLQSGFAQFRELAARRLASITYTAIFDDNQPARRALESARLGLPSYHDQGALHTAAIFVPSRAGGVEEPLVDDEEVAAFLNERRRQRDLSPVVLAAHLQQMSAVVITRAGGRINGVAALCDLRDQRQMRVHRHLGALRPLNWLLRLCGYRALPSAGELVPAVFVSYFEADNYAAGRALLRRLRAAASQRKAGLLLLTQHESDPLRRAPSGLMSMRSRGRLYEVAWNAAAPVTSLHLPLVEGFSL